MCIFLFNYFLLFLSLFFFFSLIMGGRARTPCCHDKHNLSTPQSAWNPIRQSRPESGHDCLIFRVNMKIYFGLFSSPCSDKQMYIHILTRRLPSQ